MMWLKIRREKKDHQDHAEKVVGQQISNHFHGLEVLSRTRKDRPKHQSPESQPHQNHDEGFLSPFFLWRWKRPFLKPCILGLRSR